MTHPLREAHDYYPTPAKATRALLSVERFAGSIWEPACGNGAISRILIRAGHYVVSTDLVDRGFGLGGVNFLSETEPRARHIITNPHYHTDMPRRFLLHALSLTRLTGGTTALLLDLAGLAHPSRTSLYTANPPAAVYILDELVCWPANRRADFAAQNRFAWLIWKPGHQGRPTLWWLNTAGFERPEDSR